MTTQEVTADIPDAPESPLSFSTPLTLPGGSLNQLDVSLVAEKSLEDTSEEETVDTFEVNSLEWLERMDDT